MVDLLIRVNNADLQYSFVDIRGKAGEPVARLGPLGWTCIGPPDGRAEPRSQCVTPDGRAERPPDGRAERLKRDWNKNAHNSNTVY